MALSVFSSGTLWSSRNTHSSGEMSDLGSAGLSFKFYLYVSSQKKRQIVQVRVSSLFCLFVLTWNAEFSLLALTYFTLKNCR